MTTSPSKTRQKVWRCEGCGWVHVDCDYLRECDGCGEDRVTAELDRAQLARIVKAARPLSRLPLPVSSDERVEWLTYWQRLKEVFGG